MLSYIIKNINIQCVKRFILSFALFCTLTMFCRLFTNETLDFSRDLGYVASFSFLYALLVSLWQYDKKHLRLCLVFVGLYFLSALIKRCSDIIFPEREITHTIGLALILFSWVSLLYYTSLTLKIKILHKFVKIISLILCVIFILPALVFLGYAVVQQGIFSPDIALTLFQTNVSEIAAYLQDRNLWHWGLGSLCIITFVFLYIRNLCTLKSEKFKLFNYIIVWMWLIYSSLAIMPKLNLSSLIGIIQTTKATLGGFNDFREMQQNRLAKLADLLKTNILTSDNGVYVLVIGESENRDHMQIYGYERQTTPWLDKLSEDDNTIVFVNAYANHTHTVPTLTYALSEKNQYNEISQSDAFSIIEVAKAAGFKTYWLSNQAKYEVCDTPVNTIAFAADKQSWINVNIGDKLATSYYDEKLVDELPDYDNSDKILIVFHLMGNHAAYRDRYPVSFDRFEGRGRHIDAYDNSVLYNDYVLQKIYNKVKKYPDFKAFVYLSDHGDDVDNGLGHESSRFSYQMARIPLIINVSEKFVEDKPERVENMRENKNAYWSNDLLYNLMTALMGIDGLPNVHQKYNLLSDEYGMQKQDIILLHGEKTLDNEI